MPEETISTSDSYECPYCGADNFVESEDYSEDASVWDCCECGLKFHGWQHYSVSHWAKPDCELNNQEHVWVPRQRRDNNAKYYVCRTCDNVTNKPPYRSSAAGEKPALATNEKERL